MVELLLGRFIEQFLPLGSPVDDGGQPFPGLALPVWKQASVIEVV